MDPYRELADRIKQSTGTRQSLLYQGIVTKVSGKMCSLKIGGIEVEAKLRASEIEDEQELLITPKVGSAVVAGTLSGDMNDLVVFAVDQAESITINGGQLGGLVNIRTLTEKLNEFVNTYNGHTHTGAHGPTSAPLTQGKTFATDDYEDKKVTH